MKTPSDQIWAYLHNQLSPEQRDEFEHALANDPTLQTQLKESQAMHEQLIAIQPTVEHEERSDDQLVEDLIAEWEAENPEYAETTPRKRTRKILQFSIPLAAAAALILLALPATPVTWQRTTYGSPPQLRGAPANPSRYTRAELRETSRDLQHAVDAAYHHPDKWSLKIHMQELAEGALSLEVTGRTRLSIARRSENSRNVVRWSDHFLRLEDLQHNLPLVGEQIANEL